jgi:hypothetical protein
MLLHLITKTLKKTSIHFSRSDLSISIEASQRSSVYHCSKSGVPVNHVLVLEVFLHITGHTIMSIVESAYGPLSGQGLIFGILLLVSSDLH